MRVLVVDQWGDGALDFAVRCHRAGHQVKLFMQPGDRTEPIGKGLVEKVREWQPWARWADFIFVCNNTKYLRDLDRFRREGALIIGPSEEAAAWELDRCLGMEVFSSHGIEVPPYREFSDYDKAIAYVKKQDRPFVSKPCGDEPDKAMSYVAKTPADLVYMLQRWKAKGKKQRFILQELVDGVAEMAVGGWFGPGGFNAGWHENWEFKRLFNGDLGQNTGEMGTVVRVVAKSRLADRVLRPLAKSLAELGYVGYIDVNCIIDADGQPWPLEFTMRPGWPTFQIQQALNKGDPAQWLMDLAEGRDARNWTMDQVAVGVVMALPDYPYSRWSGKEVVGVPIYGITPRNLDSLHPSQVMMGMAPQSVNGKVIEAPQWVSAGDYLLVATGLGDGIAAARSSVYRVLKQLKQTPGSPFWRTDIGQSLSKSLPTLQSLGYAAGMTY